MTPAQWGWLTRHGLSAVGLRKNVGWCVSGCEVQAECSRAGGVCVRSTSGC